MIRNWLNLGGLQLAVETKVPILHNFTATQGRVRFEDVTTENPEVLPIRLIAPGHENNNKNDGSRVGYNPLKPPFSECVVKR